MLVGVQARFLHKAFRVGDVKEFTHRGKKRRKAKCRTQSSRLETQRQTIRTVSCPITKVCEFHGQSEPRARLKRQECQGEGAVSWRPLETDRNLYFLRLYSLGLKIRKGDFSSLQGNREKTRIQTRLSGGLQEKQCLSSSKGETEGSQKYQCWDRHGHWAVLLSLSREAVLSSPRECDLPER